MKKKTRKGIPIINLFKMKAKKSTMLDYVSLGKQQTTQNSFSISDKLLLLFCHTLFFEGTKLYT